MENTFHMKHFKPGATIKRVQGGTGKKEIEYR